MAFYVTKKCPHCGYAYQILQSGEQRKYGCPCKVCESCGKPYWDRDIVEPALHGFENTYERVKTIKGVILITLFAIIAIFCLVVGFWVMSMGMSPLAPLGVFAFSALIVGIYIYNRIYEKMHWNEIVRDRQIEYDKSMERLKDNDYLIALANFDKRAKKLLSERMDGETEHYANRP